MKNDYEINLQRAFTEYFEADRKWLLSIDHKLSEEEQEKAYKEKCFYMEQYRKAVNAPQDTK
jgi:hypothetical protein